MTFAAFIPVILPGCSSPPLSLPQDVLLLWPGQLCCICQGNLHNEHHSQYLPNTTAAIPAIGKVWKQQEGEVKRAFYLS